MKSPKLFKGVYIHKQDHRVLYFNPVPPDWITINEKYKPIFDCFDGNNSIDKIVSFINEHYQDEKTILVPQVIEFLETSNVIERDRPYKEKTHSNNKALAHPSPKYIYLTLTDQCNLKCKYCYAIERKQSNDAILETWKNYIKEILTVAKTPIFIFTGGEPLLEPNIYNIAQTTYEYGCENILLTNGTLIQNKNIAEKIAKLFSLVKISLDSIDEDLSKELRGPGIVQKVQTAFNLLKDMNCNVQILATVTSITKEYLDSLSSHFEGKVSFQPFYSMGRGRFNSELSITGHEYYKALTRTDVFRLLPCFHRNIHNYKNRPFKRCAMANEEISLNASGDIFPCHMLHYPELNCGNLNQESFRSIYYNSPILKKLRGLDVDHIDQCRICIFRNICGGACRARVDIQKNGLDGTNEFCTFEKNSILDALMYSYG